MILCFVKYAPVRTRKTVWRRMQSAGISRILPLQDTWHYKNTKWLCKSLNSQNISGQLKKKQTHNKTIAVSVLLKIAHWLCVEGLPLLFVIVSSDMINDIICKLFVIICHRICVIFLQDVTSLTCTVHSSMAIYDNELELEKLLCIVTKSGVWDSGA